MRPETATAYCPAAQAALVWQPATPAQAAVSAPAMPALLVMRYCSAQAAAVKEKTPAATAGSAATSETAELQSAAFRTLRAAERISEMLALLMRVAVSAEVGQVTYLAWDPEPAGVQSAGMVTPLAARGVRVMPQPAPRMPAVMEKELRHLAKGLALQAPPPVEKRSTVKEPARRRYSTKFQRRGISRRKAQFVGKEERGRGREGGEAYQRCSLGRVAAEQDHDERRECSARPATSLRPHDHPNEYFLQGGSALRLGERGLGK